MGLYENRFEILEGIAILENGVKFSDVEEVSENQTDRENADLENLYKFD